MLGMIDRQKDRFDLLFHGNPPGWPLRHKRKGSAIAEGRRLSRRISRSAISANGQDPHHVFPYSLIPDQNRVPMGDATALPLTHKVKPPIYGPGEKGLLSKENARLYEVEARGDFFRAL
jgi:hypothetical protein